jgi:hypothetical protein
MKQVMECMFRLSSDHCMPTTDTSNANQINTTSNDLNSCLFCDNNSFEFKFTNNTDHNQCNHPLSRTQSLLQCSTYPITSTHSMRFTHSTRSENVFINQNNQNNNNTMFDDSVPNNHRSQNILSNSYDLIDTLDNVSSFDNTLNTNYNYNTSNTYSNNTNNTQYNSQQIINRTFSLQSCQSLDQTNSHSIARESEELKRHNNNGNKSVNSNNLMTISSNNRRVRCSSLSDSNLTQKPNHYLF